MATHKNFITGLLICLLSATAGAQSGKPAVTLDQAVLNVQQQTGGRVLSAESHRVGVGHGQRYFIKVLTPAGHVRKLVVSSEPDKQKPASRRPTKNPPVRRAGNKEKH